MPPASEEQPWDFEHSTHPQEQGCFNLALTAWEFFHEDTADYDQETDHDQELPDFLPLSEPGQITI